MTAGAAERVAVVGGGIIGLACAWRLAQRGAAVSVIDPMPGSGASDVAAGMLAPVTEVHYGEETLLALNLESARRWPSFAAELEGASERSIDFAASGTIAVAYDGDDLAALEAIRSYLSELGLPAERLKSRQARELEPMLAPAVRGGMLAAGDHRVDPRTVTAALTAACRAGGVELIRSRVEAIEQAAGRGAGRLRVRIAAGESLSASTVVLAAGAASATIELPRPEDVPAVRPVKGQIVTVRTPHGEPPLLGRAVRATVQGASVYLVPRRDGRIVIGATAEEKGWDSATTAGGVYELLRDAMRVVPGISECELVEARTGFRPGTPDNAPLLGPGATPGLVMATGHFRNGILLAPVTADAIAELVVSGAVPRLIEAFDATRFPSRHGERVRTTDGSDQPNTLEAAGSARAGTIP